MEDKRFTKAVTKARKFAKRYYTEEQISSVDAPMDYLAVDGESVNCMVLYQATLRRKLLLTRVAVVLLILCIIGAYYG